MSSDVRNRAISRVASHVFRLHVGESVIQSVGDDNNCHVENMEADGFLGVL